MGGGGMGSGGMGDKKRKKSKKSKKKSKKSRKEYISSSSSDSSSSSSEDEAEKKRLSDERKARKLSKQLKSGVAVDAGYTNEDNRFGDTNITERFVWHKKLEKQIADGVDPKDLGLKAEKQKHEARLKEIERVKKRRDDREMEKAAQEEEKDMMLRERAIAEAVELEKKEEDFHLNQAKVRSTIRLQEGRAKPIDVLYKNLNAAPEEFDLNAEQPELIFSGLTHRETVALQADLKSHLELAGLPLHKEFWTALHVLCEAELVDSAKREEEERARFRGAAVVEAAAPVSGGGRQGLHASVDADVKAMLEGKSYEDLLGLQEQIEDTLASGDGEVEYWDAVLKRLRVFKARARLAQLHDDMVANAREARATGGAGIAEAMGWDQEEGGPPRGGEGAGPSGASEWEAEEPEDDMEGRDLVAFSPVYMAESDVPEGEEVLTPEQDLAALNQLRRAVAKADGRAFGMAAAVASRTGPSQVGDAAYRKMVAGGDKPPPGSFFMTQHITIDGKEMEYQEEQSKALAVKTMGAAEQGEIDFKGEVVLEKQAYWWHDKYRPRKPKYFNRVHTGYEWNKYNQTHYDHDNPPPKVVQGYKFNVFYPDLIDKTKAPTYKVVPDGSTHSETALLIFHAGPPYEDIAFKICNKDWEYSHKRGFKCSFERGIMHLYINFKRYRYRR